MANTVLPPQVGKTSVKPLSFNGVNLASPAAPVAPAIKLSDPQSIADAVQSSTNQANAANNQRYTQGLGVLAGGYTSAQNNTSALGKSELGDIQTQLQNANGQSNQDAVNRGLGNTTIRNAMLSMNQQTANKATTGVNESVANLQNGLYTGGAGAISNFIAGRNDVAPDINSYASLLQNAQLANLKPNTATVQNGSINDPIKIGGGTSTGYQGGSIAGALGGGASGAAGGSSSGGGGTAAGGATYFGPGYGTNTQTGGGLATSAPSSSDPSKAAPTQLVQNCHPYNYIWDNGKTPNAQGQICS